MPHFNLTTTILPVNSFKKGFGFTGTVCKNNHVRHRCTAAILALIELRSQDLQLPCSRGACVYNLRPTQSCTTIASTSRPSRHTEQGTESDARSVLHRLLPQAECSIGFRQVIRVFENFYYRILLHSSSRSAWSDCNLCICTAVSTELKAGRLCASALTVVKIQGLLG